MKISIVPPQRGQRDIFSFVGLAPPKRLEKPVLWVSAIKIRFIALKHPIQVEVISHTFSNLCKEVQIK